MDELDKLPEGKKIIPINIVKSKRTLYSFVLMYDASEHFLKAAKQNTEGSFFNYMASMIFCAFSLEAYFNHIGQKKLKHWKSIQRKLGPEEKFDLLDDIFKFPIDRGSRPFQSMPEIFEFRNCIVHAKTQILVNEISEHELKEKVGKIPEILKTEWEDKTTIEVAERFLIDTEEIIKQLEKIITGTDKNPFSIRAKREWISESIDLKALFSEFEHT